MGKWQNWEFGKFHIPFVGKFLHAIPQISTGKFLKSLGKYLKFPHGEKFPKKREFGNFSNVFSWEISQCIPQILRHLGSSQVSLKNFLNSQAERHFIKFKDISPQIPKGNLGSSLVPFLGKFPKRIPQIHRHMGSSKFLGELAKFPC